MRIVLYSSAAATLGLAAAAWGQTAQVTVTITLPPPAPFTVPVSQPITINGISYQAVVTFTPVGAPLPPVIPPPPPAGAISKATDTLGATVTTAPSGATVVVVGTGFGNFGSAIVAGLPAVVISWTPTGVRLTLPTTGSAAGTVTGPIILKPGDALPQVASAFAFTITGLSAELPPPSVPTQGSTVIAVSQTLDDPPANPMPYVDYIPVPEDPLLLPPAGPLVSAVLDSDGNAVTTLFDLDQPLTIAGERFRDTPGVVHINGWPALVLEWSDEKILVKSPQRGTRDLLGVAVKLPSGGYYHGDVDLRP